MESMIDSMNTTYQDFVVAAAKVIEAKETSESQKVSSTDSAFVDLKQTWELFRVACDQTEEFVESIKQRIGSECLVDEATVSDGGKPRQGVNPLTVSAVRLEQMSKAVRWLVMELQHGSSHGSNTNTNNGNSGEGASALQQLHPPTTGFDSKVSEDGSH